MRARLKNPAAALFGILLLLALACSLPGISPTPTAPPASGPVVPITGDEGGSTATEPAVTPTSNPNAPSNLPPERAGHAGDYDSSTTASSRQAAGGDRFTFGRYERPFNAETMDVYYAHLDIVDTLVYEDGRYIYGVLTLKGGDQSGALPGNYAFELDLDLNGSGDWMVFASAPASTDWTAQGVQVWNDSNGDVGGLTTVSSDQYLFSGDGYDHLVAENGQGESPDAGWVRIDPNSPNTIQMAIATSLLGGDSSYLAGMWAGSSSLVPAQFDFNDRMTHEQAGAADPGLENFYPIKQLAELDNSCRMAIGFEPSGKEPGLCPEIVPTPEPKACKSNSREEYACIQRGGTWNKQTCKCKEAIIY